MTVLNVKNFQFKNAELTFPISVFISFKNYIKVLNIYFWIFVISLTITILTQLKYNFYALCAFIFLLIFYGFFIFLFQKPKLLLYPDKVILVNHGLGEPKTLAWQDCVFDTDHCIDGMNDMDTIILYLLSQNDKGEKYRFCVLNLNTIRFNDKQFSMEEHLEIFKEIKNSNFKAEN